MSFKMDKKVSLSEVNLHLQSLAVEQKLKMWLDQQTTKGKKKATPTPSSESIPPPSHSDMDMDERMDRLEEDMRAAKNMFLAKSKDDADEVSISEMPSDMKKLLDWLGQIPFRKFSPKSGNTNLSRAFSDGVLMAEVIYHFYPKLIELHSYVSANGPQRKRHNWELLNRKVFPKIGLKLTERTIDAICASKAGHVEIVLHEIRRLTLVMFSSPYSSSHSKSEDGVGFGGGEGDGGGHFGGGETREDTCIVHIHPVEGIPDYVVYKREPYFPLSLVEDKDGKIEDLSRRVKELVGKNQSLETLLQIKESHLIDLTKRVHFLQLKLGQAKHESLCGKWGSEKNRGHAHPCCGMGMGSATVVDAKISATNCATGTGKERKTPLTATLSQSKIEELVKERPKSGRGVTTEGSGRTFVVVDSSDEEC